VSFPACIVTLPLLGYTILKTVITENNRTDCSASELYLAIVSTYNIGVLLAMEAMGGRGGIVLATTIHDGPDSNDDCQSNRERIYPNIHA